MTIVMLLTALPAKAAGGFVLLGGFWVIVFGFVCWRTAESIRNAIDKGEGRYSTNQLHLRLAGLTLGVLVTQAILLTLAVSAVEGNNIAGPAFFRFLGIAGSTSLLVPVCFWSRPKAWLPSVVAFLIYAGLIVWWEVVRNLWPDELLLGPAIGLATFVLSTLLARPALKSKLDRIQSS
ncbi:MAG: hypothetical protein OXH45_09560 [Gammaproteobacteria bacterium]|nr:hypothetical protein [Gammaproteobacteria bacterium]